IEVAAAFPERNAALLEIVECGEARAEARALRQCLEIGVRQARFRAHPGTGCGGIEGLEPAIRVRNRRAVVVLHHRARGSGRLPEPLDSPATRAWVSAEARDRKSTRMNSSTT